MTACGMIRFKANCRRLSASLWLCLLCLCGKAAQFPDAFYHIDTYYGLDGNEVVHILQLDDGRMVFTTDKGVNIYDGLSFRNYPRRDAAELRLPDYYGACHVYIGKDGMLWVKNNHSLVLLDLKRERYAASPERCLRQMGVRGLVLDVFVDSERNVWAAVGSRLFCPERRLALPLEAAYGNLQDVDVDSSRAYLFFSTGEVRCHSLESGKLVYANAAYPKARSRLYDGSSLIVKGGDGCFYQKRCGVRSVCMAFDTATRRWAELLETPYTLHTIVLCPGKELYASCGKGLWSIDLATRRPTYRPELAMAEGGRVAPQVNTVFRDRQGGWWLGTYNKGLLYANAVRNGAHPSEAALLPALRPLLVGMSVGGEPLGLSPGGSGRPLKVSLPYLRSIDLAHDQNDIVFTFSSLNYALPTRTTFRYRLIRNGAAVKPWSELPKAAKPTATLPFSDLRHGHYLLQVMAGVDGHYASGAMAEVAFSISAPWWLAWWAYVLYALLCVIFAAALVLMRLSWRKRNARERALMERVQQLIARCNQYEATENEDGAETLPASDSEFVKKAVSLVEANLGSAYGVEQLSRDLCMERTGLYKKLSGLLDQSPSMFIRSIRLKKAASMLAGTDKTVAEIATLTGFSSASYLGKCFLEEYGCRPSEYAAKHRKH